MSGSVLTLGGLARRLWDVASSRRLSVWLMSGVALGYAVWVVPFQVYGVPAWRVRNIAGGLAFEILGALLLANAIACVIRQAPGIARRCSGSFGDPEQLLDGSRARAIATDVDASRALDAAARRLRRRGYRVRREPGRVYARFGRFSSVGTVLFHLALTLIAVSAILSAQGYFRGKAVLVEGEAFDGSVREAYAEPSVDEMAAIPESRLPAVTFELLTIEPAFWKDVQLFTKLEARISHAGERSRVIAVNRPAHIGDASVAIDGFGYAPEFRIEGPEGTIADGFVKLKVFPPGSTDRVDIAGSPYQIEIQVFPDASLDGKKIQSRSFNLVDPLVLLRVRDVMLDEGGSPAYEGELRLGETAEFFGYTVTVPSIRYYAEVRIVRNPGVPWFVAALLTGMAGLVLRVVFRQRFVAVAAEDSAAGSIVRVGATAEFWRSAWRVRVFGGIAMALGADRVDDERLGRDSEDDAE